jgi:hypothetical protein
MRPDDTDLDAEIRGHLALSVKERIERGEDPEAAHDVLGAGNRRFEITRHHDQCFRNWRLRRKRIGRGIVGVSAPEAI